MKSLFVTALLLAGCTAEKVSDAPAVTTAAPVETTTTAAAQTTAAAAPTTTTAAEAVEPPLGENAELGTWAGQIGVAQPVSMFNYVGAESGDFAPLRFRTDSVAGKKILAACSNGDQCEFTGAVEWLDEVPPENASAVGQILRVDSVKRLPPAQ